MTDKEYKRYVDTRAAAETAAIQRRLNRQAWEARQSQAPPVLTYWQKILKLLKPTR